MNTEEEIFNFTISNYDDEEREEDQNNNIGQNFNNQNNITRPITIGNILERILYPPAGRSSNNSSILREYMLNNNLINTYFVSVVYDNESEYDTEEEYQPPQIKVHSFIYDSQIHDIENNECSICADKYKNNDEIAILKCDHLFHKNCLEEWSIRNPICPLCRCDIPCEEEEQDSEREEE